MIDGFPRRAAAPVALLVALLAVWEIAASVGAIGDALDLQDYLVASPSEIAEVMWDDRGLLADNALVTLWPVLLGFGLAIVAGVTTALALHLSGILRASVYPLLVASQTVPIVVVAPILVVWLGFGMGPKLAIVALVCYFPIAVNTLDGLRSVDPEAVKMMRTLHAGRLQILHRVELPTALPHIFTGARIAAAIAVIGAVFGEWSGSSAGLGHLILQDDAQLNTPRMFASITLLSAIAIGLFASVTLLERRFVPWR